ncbi:hypothetical protein QP175_10250 [Sphingomonas aerolata]|uniref:hypothetical protein n=1 Tax=Sphingomonas aerolata TaxID=185951 RepID=UPI002FE31483
MTAAWARMSCEVTEVIGAAEVMLGRWMRDPVTTMSPPPARSSAGGASTALVAVAASASTLASAGVVASACAGVTCPIAGVADTISAPASAI